MTLDYYAEIRIACEDAAQQVRIPSQGLAGIVANIAFVVVEICILRLTAEYFGA